MRKVVLGMVMAGMMLPGVASAQDEGRQREWADRRDHPTSDGDRRGPGPGEPRAQQAARDQRQGQPQAQRPQQAQPQPQQRGRFGGRDRADGAGRRDGDPQGLRPQPGAPNGAGQRDARAFGGRDRFASGRPFDDDRLDRAPPGERGPGGYRAQGGPPIAPGSGGYRPQPGQFGYDQGRPGAPAFRPAPSSQGRGGAWNRGWRDDRRFDYRQYRTQNNYLFRLPRYQVPRGWGHGYRRFTPGLTLSAGLFDRGYWIDDPFAYRLPPAYGPYRWVRYYNDALLIDLRSGVVVDTVADLFW